MMKPNDRMTRQQLLDIVDESLRSAPSVTSADSATLAESATLGKAASDAASPMLTAGVLEQIQVSLRSFPDDTPELSSHHDSVSNSSSSPSATPSHQPIPLPDVAAYVDGTLTNPQQQLRITQSAMTDAGLLMEIVMARRSQKLTQERPVSSDLRSRLLALHTADTAVSTTHDPMPQVQVTPLVQNAEDDPSDATRPIMLQVVAVLAVAAAVLIAAGVWWMQGSGGDGPSIASDPSVVSPNQKDRQRSEDENPSSDGGSSSQPSLAPGPTLAASSDRADADDSDVRVFPKRDGIVLDSPDERDPFELRDDSPMPESIRLDGNSVASDERREEDAMSAVDAVVRDGDADPAMDDPSALVSQPLVATWSQIDGVLVQSNAIESELTSESSDAILQSVASGTSSQLASTSADSRLRLETLPFCRADGELASGGRLILAPNTRLELDASGAIDLQYGSIALVDVKHTSPIRLGNSPGQSLLFRVKDESSFVVRKTVDGMEVDTTDQGVQINGRSFSGQRVLVDTGAMSVKASDETIEKLPKWTRGRVDRIDLGRSVLANLATSNDLQASLNDALRNTRDAKSATLLRKWLVSTHSGSLLSLAGADDPLLREAALSHLRLVTPADPRNRPLWQELRARSRSPRVVATVHSYFVDLWSGKRPNATRFEQLLRLLHSREPATRAMSDYLLRSFYGTGPALDLNASPQARLRSANMWRTIANRADR